MCADVLTPATTLLDGHDDLATPAFHLGVEHDAAGDHLGIFPEIPSGTETTTSGSSGTLAAAYSPLASIPVLNSLAGAAASIYLDFNGHFESVWGSYRNITTPVFDQDGDLTTFSDGELATIQKVWAQVAEDYAPFNINVTTVEPASFADGVAVRASIGGNGAWLGAGAGGVAYVDSFTNSIANTVYVFPSALSNGYARYVGEAVSHELGHSFGLDHQSLFSSTGSKLDEYNPGSSAQSPIMGGSYSATRGLWWAGQDSSNTYQDDMSVISRAYNGFGYRADDYGNTAASAAPLTVNNGAVTGSGIITTTGDVDYFSFSTGAGQVSFTIDVSAGINNLDSRLELRDSSGVLIASAAPTTSFGASLTASVAAGSYRLMVGSQGSYGDVGQYTVSGTIIPATASTVAAPTGLAAVRGPSSVTLSWTDNATNETKVSVERRLNGGTWTQVAALPANATSYVDSAVAAGTKYEYRVQAANDTDASNFSNIAGVTFAPAAPANLTAKAVSGTRVDLAWSNVAGETGYKVGRLASGGVWTQIAIITADVVTYQDLTASPGVSYQYRVRATNAGGDSAFSNFASATTPNVLTKPAAPSSLTAFINTSRQVQLSWKDNSTNEKVFVVQRSTNNYTWTTLGQVAANSTSSIDLSAVRGRVYYYRVLAYNAAGYSAPSNSARVTTPAYGRAATLTSAATASGTAVIEPLRVPNVPTSKTMTSTSKVAPKPASNIVPSVFASDATWLKTTQAAPDISHFLATTSARQSSGWSSEVDAVLSGADDLVWLKKG